MKLVKQFVISICAAIIKWDKSCQYWCRIANRFKKWAGNARKWDRDVSEVISGLRRCGKDINTDN